MSLALQLQALAYWRATVQYASPVRVYLCLKISVISGHPRIEVRQRHLQRGNGHTRRTPRETSSVALRGRKLGRVQTNLPFLASFCSARRKAAVRMQRGAVRVRQWAKCVPNRGMCRRVWQS